MFATEPRSSLFDRLGIQVDNAAFDRLVEQARQEFLPPRLEEVGLSVTRQDAGPEAPLVRTAAESAAILASSFTVAQAAERLGVDPSRVRQRLSDHTLYGVKARSGWRLPRFQFTDHGVLPGLDVLAPCLFALHPVVVVRWLTAPHPDLVVAAYEQPVSPRRWLEIGLAPSRVAPWLTNYTVPPELARCRSSPIRPGPPISHAFPRSGMSFPLEARSCESTTVVSRRGRGTPRSVGRRGAVRREPAARAVVLFEHLGHGADG